MSSSTEPALRLDLWLWYARFFKSRSIAAQAVKGGHVRLNGQRPKPSKDVQVGDVVSIVRSHHETEVAVRSIPSRRGPASEASLCYAETADSVAARERREADRRDAGSLRAPTDGRPDKRTRRLIRSHLRDGSSPK